ncbi:hypothetical protein Tco_0943133 [Tanacetum coccineum]
MSAIAIDQVIAQRVADALAEYEANQNSRNGNGNENDNGKGSHDSGSGGGRTLHTARMCTYKEFFNCQPLNFKGTKGAVGLAHWFEKMINVFHISDCTLECQVRYATCTLLGGALTWWNSHVRTVRYDAAYGMAWKTLMKMMTEAYFLRSEIKKLETKLWKLTVKGTDVESYTQPFLEFVLLCSKMIPDESDKLERYVRGLPDSIQGSVMASKLEMLQEANELERSLMDQKGLYCWPGEKTEYARTLPMCNKCKFHHNEPCIAKCTNCKRVGHLTQYYRSPTAADNQRTLSCFECGNQGHYKSDCPKLKNQGRGNQSGSVKLVEGCMLWEEEKLIKTLTTIQNILMLRERSFLSLERFTLYFPLSSLYSMDVLNRLSIYI